MATEHIFNKLLQQLCATDFGDGSFYHRSGLEELCFPNYDLEQLDGEEGDVTTWIPRVQIMDEPNVKGAEPTKFLLDAAQLHQIACYVLPRELAFRKWKRLFSLGRDGADFEGFMKRVQKDPQTLLIVRTTKGETFGAYSDTQWEFDNNRFHGGERTKLFSFVKRPTRWASSRSLVSTTSNDTNVSSYSGLGEARDDCEEKAEKKEPLTVYCWSGLSREYQYTDPSRTLIGFGGGGARFGLSIEKNFRIGSTGPSETFGNENLGTEGAFRVAGVEVWGFAAVEDTCCSSLLCFQPDHKPEEDMNWIPPVQVTREAPHVRENFILDQAKMNQIARFVLPRGIADCRWKRVYSLSRDGDSFEQCLHLIRKEPRSLMVIKTEENQIFGGYADSPWRANNCNYYGSAQANLWTFNRNKIVGLESSQTSIPNSTVDPNQVKVFKWTGVNRYIQYCDMTHRIMAFGGGGDEGSFGLCVEKEFQRGTTGPCATFGNDQELCKDASFKILDLEIWGFMVGNRHS